MIEEIMLGNWDEEKCLEVHMEILLGSWNDNCAVNYYEKKNI